MSENSIYAIQFDTSLQKSDTPRWSMYAVTLNETAAREKMLQLKERQSAFEKRRAKGTRLILIEAESTKVLESFI